MRQNYEIKCAICGEQTHYKRWSDFNRYHIHKVHNLIMNDKEYFDKYVREEKEGFCVMCGKPTRFVDFFERYSKYCSTQCINDDPRIKEIQIQKRKDFFENISEEKRENRNKKLKEIWDSRTEEKVNQMVNKGKSTKKERYGDEKYNNPDKIKEESLRNTLIEINDELKNTSFKIIDKDENGNFVGYCDDCKQNFIINKPHLYIRRKLEMVICTNCNKPTDRSSYMENNVSKFIKENYSGEILHNKRFMLKDREIDIYLPELKLGIEFNGLYWHNETKKPIDYHYDKTIRSEDVGIYLIHIYEDDWLYKQDIVKSNILKILNKCEKIDSNNLKIINVDYTTSLNFLKENSLYYFKDFDVSLGMYDKDNLIYIMCFKKLTSSNYKLVDCCDLKFLQVENGFENILNYFVNNFDVKEIEYIADRSWINKNSSKYLDYGFKLETVIKEDFKYIFKTIRLNKDDKSTKDILKERDLLKIYDSGQLKFVYKR